MRSSPKESNKGQFLQPVRRECQLCMREGRQRAHAPPLGALVAGDRQQGMWEAGKLGRLAGWEHTQAQLHPFEKFARSCRKPDALPDSGPMGPQSSSRGHSPSTLDASRQQGPFALSKMNRDGGRCPAWRSLPYKQGRENTCFSCP